MPLNMNDAPEQRKYGEVMPDGVFVKVQMNIKAGGATLNGQDPGDAGLFKNSTISDAVMLEVEFTVLEPKEYEHRKVFENWTVAGGSLDDKGNSKGWNMTKARLRAVLESATGTSPKDTSAQAMANRTVPNFKSFDNCPFYAKLTVEAGGDRPQGGKYPDKNVIDYVVTPDEPEYAALKAGQPVEPKPRYSKGAQASSGSASGKTTAGASSAPAWQRGAAAPAGTPAAAAPAQPAPSTPAAGPAWLRS